MTDSVSLLHANLESLFSNLKAHQKEQNTDKAELSKEIAEIRSDLKSHFATEVLIDENYSTALKHLGNKIELITSRLGLVEKAIDKLIIQRENKKTILTTIRENISWVTATALAIFALLAYLGIVKK